MVDVNLSHLADNSGCYLYLADTGQHIYLRPHADPGVFNACNKISIVP